MVSESEIFSGSYIKGGPGGRWKSNMMKLKGCPRCQGDLFVNENRDGWSEQCLQCGYEKDVKATCQPRQKTTVGKSDKKA